MCWPLAESPVLARFTPPHPLTHTHKHCTWIRLRLLVTNVHYGATVATLAGYGDHALWFAGDRKRQWGPHHRCRCFAGLFVLNVQRWEIRLILQQDRCCQREHTHTGDFGAKIVGPVTRRPSVRSRAPNKCCSRGGNVPSDTCIRLDPFRLQSSELEDVVFDEDWHFLFMVMGTLQLSKYLRITRTEQWASLLSQSTTAQQPDRLSSPLKLSI